MTSEVLAKERGGRMKRMPATAAVHRLNTLIAMRYRKTSVMTDTDRESSLRERRDSPKTRKKGTARIPMASVPPAVSSYV
jgi:hypothetical protein